MGIIILLSIFIIAVVMTVKEIKEGMTAPEVAQTIKDNFDALNNEKETVENVGKVKEGVDNANKNTGVSNYPAFSATEDVAVGVVRNYNGLLYRSIVAGANEWNEANWERVSLESLQNEKLTELASKTKVITITEGDNLLNYKESVVGLVSSTDGEIDISQSNWRSSGFIEIPNPKKGLFFCTLNAGNVGFYDKDYNWIYTQENTRYSTTRTILQDGVVYARVSFPASSTTDFFYVAGNRWETQPVFSPYIEPITKIKNLVIPELENYAKKIEIEKTFELIGLEENEASANILNKETSILGELKSDGSINTSFTNYKTSDFIIVENNLNNYYCGKSSYYKVGFYDESKNLVYYQENIPYSTGRKITRDGVVYARVTYPSNDLEPYFYISSVPFEYAPEYTEYKKEGATLNPNAIRNITIKDDGKITLEDKSFSNMSDSEHHLISIGHNTTQDKKSAAIAIGTNSLSCCIGDDNSDNGHYNVAIGHNSMRKNTTGNHNTAVGWGTMIDNIDGSGNTAVGEDALCHTVSGNSNTAIGNRAMQMCTGSHNVAIGALSMYSSSDKVPSGDYNVAIGEASGCTNEGNGDNNTAIGNRAGCDASLRYTITIGSNTRATKSRQVVIGSTALGTPHPLETILNGDIIICGTDYVYRRLLFNEDGTIRWIDVSEDYSPK